MHEIAKILGPDMAEKELLSILFGFMKDIDEVREGVTINLPKFIESLRLEQRESFIEKLS